MTTDRTRLDVPIDEARRRISEQIDRGKALLERRLNSQADVDQAWDEHKKWTEYARALVERMFSTNEVADELASAGAAPLIAVGGFDLARERHHFERAVRRYVRSLESIHDRLELFGEREERADDPPERTNGTNVFIVHGRDEGPRESVARFLEQLGLRPVILHEWSSQGRAIRDKLIEVADEADFAVVLLTPDDEGRRMGSHEDLEPRARQNVVLELGFFLAKLGPTRVVALRKEHVEIPSDYQGIVHILYDDAGGWRQYLVRELKTVWPNVSIDAAN